MTYSGNDVVSLAAINIARTKQSRFYSKILTASEMTLYRENGFAQMHFEKFVWLLWSLKESAFKFLQRNNPALVFSPTKFVVNYLSMPLGYAETKFGASEIEDCGFDNRSVFKGAVTYGFDTFFSRSLVYQELIASVANDHSNFENTWWGIKLIDKPYPENQSLAVRKFLVDKLQSLLHLNGLRVDKSAHGFPVVRNGNKEVAISVSLSHHNHVVAYSFSSENLESLRTPAPLVSLDMN
jgi:phosphopantetheinyl transferase (holo-ACP synthase)